ncbi:MAG TPA: AAA family ATPase, partial [Alphaproteobacteria bacterium]|nr:AAA family ATPase [Alphaproteobacteria bacterium]
ERGRLNARLSADLLDHVAEPDTGGRALINQAAETMGLTARSYHRVLRTARTIADLDGSDGVRRVHIAEALSLRRSPPRNETGAGSVRQSIMRPV